MTCQRSTLARAACLVLLIGNALAADIHANTNSRHALSVDNDMFAFRGLDRDYTGGGRLSFTSTAELEELRPGERLLAWLDQASGWQRQYRKAPSGRVDKTLSLGLQVFAPEDLAAVEPVPGERPFANLLYVSRSRFAQSADGRDAFQSTLTVGALGTPAGEAAHKTIHRITGATIPRGYDGQLSDGGEPTLRYAAAYHRFLMAAQSPRLSRDLRLKLEGGAGYVTDAGISVTARFGRFPAGSWTLVSEQSHYLTQPFIPMSMQRGDWVVWSSVGLRAQAYNALLQGQFRHRDNRLHASQVNDTIVDWGVGMTWALSTTTTVNYALRGSSREVNSSAGRRSMRWGGLTITRQLRH